MPAVDSVGGAANRDGFFGSCTFFDCDAPVAVLQIRLGPLLVEKTHMSSKHVAVISQLATNKDEKIAVYVAEISQYELKACSCDANLQTKNEKQKTTNY